MAYSGSQVTQIRPCALPQAKPAGSFSGKTEAAAPVEEGGVWIVAVACISLLMGR